MSEGEGTAVDPKAHATSDTYGETLLYDYAKHLTGLSLLALGGVLTVTQATGGKDIKPAVIWLVAICLALAGILAFGTAGSLVDARATGKAPKAYLPKMMKGGTLFFALGTGAFLTMWLDAIV